MKRKTGTIIAYVSSVIVLVVIWFIASKLINASLILPDPFLVLDELIHLLVTKSFWIAFAYTFLRVLVSFFITVILGTVIGVICGLNVFIKDFIEFPLAVIRATPVVAFILIALFWFRSGSVPLFVSVLMTLPLMITAVANGFSKADVKLLEMTKVFNFSKKQVFKYVQLPAIVPFFLNGTVSSFGLTWKVVVAGEVISLPKYGAGTVLQYSQVHLETSTVIAVTIFLVLVSFILERFFSLLVKMISVKKGLK